MIFEKGTKQNPTGNLILYCNVIGENPVQPGGRIIASNVVVSFLKLGDNFPVVTFPPVALPSLDELKKLIDVNLEAYDIARLPDFELPENKEEANRYIQDQMERFNQVVMRYVEFCKTKEKKPHNDIDKDIQGVEGYLEALANLSMEFRKSTGLAREATQLKVDRIVHKFSSNHPQYDLDNFKKALDFPGNQGDELVGLYLKKFNAISLENYEVASNLKRKIVEIETTESKY
ncbi:MAG: hypothetical protein O9346_08165 [Leptospiraceae bacterium]|jgi:hypothetical protein|nr:hypothetical protein [Leptospiraceae bacterium]MCZ8346375.1 hypothetical protein [Leptospiraceae bacterium]PJE01769.1 MAG: hypothetical protein CK427_09615 [Leptospira sp.]